MQPPEEKEEEIRFLKDRVTFLEKLVSDLQRAGNSCDNNSDPSEEANSTDALKLAFAAGSARGLTSQQASYFYHAWQGEYMYPYVVRRPYMVLKTHAGVVERQKEGYVGPWKIDTFGELTPTCGGPGEGGGGYPKKGNNDG